MTSEKRVAKSWYMASRWQEFEGEATAAVLRVLLVLVFYAIQLTHYFSLAQIDDSDRTYHRAITTIAIGWLFLSLGVLVALRGGFMPPWLKYLETAVDLAFITLLAGLGQGPSSPLVLVYFLVLALAAIRFRIGLIWFATLGAMSGYMFLVGVKDKSWFDKFHDTPLVTQAITVCALGATGIILGQLVRATRCMAETFRLHYEQTAGNGGEI